MTQHVRPAGRRCTILFLGNFSHGPARNPSVSQDLARNLAVRGWGVLTASHYPQKPIRIAEMGWMALSRIRDYQIAHVDVFSGLAFSQAEFLCMLLRQLGRPYVLTLRGGNLPSFARRWPRRMRRVLRSAAAVTVPSRYLLEEMKSYGEGLRLVPNGLRLHSYPFRLRTQPRPRLVWLRAFHRLYNPVLAIRALAAVAHEFPDVRLTMVGPDKGDGSVRTVRRVAEALGVRDRVEIPGGVPKETVPQWINTGDIFINTTSVDNMPVSILEAMACGLCVVSTNVGGIPYLLEHERDALLVPPDDPEAMAMGVRRLLTEPGLAENLSRNGREKVQAFDWEPILGEWEAVFSVVAEARVS